MKRITIEELEARRAVLLRQLKNIKPLIDGSLATVNRKCGKPNCKCAKGEPHKAVILCKKVKGRSHATYIPKDMQDQVRRWNNEHKRVKKLLRQLSDINERIIRLHVRSKPRDPKLKVLKGNG